MMQSFENYLIMIGIRSSEYTYEDKTLFENIDYFKQCYEQHLSAYKALLFLNDHLHNKKIEYLNNKLNGTNNTKG